MEDILASIRRILNEDEAAPATQDAGAAAPHAQRDDAEPPEAAVSASEEPFVLTQEMMVPQADDPALPAEPPAPEPDAPAAPRSPSAEALLAPAVAAAATAAVGQLLRAVSSERHAAVTRGGPSIEDVVREELRPLLKEWLDTHLPAIVERLVQAEIERVVGRALS